jgi:GNAT superfamily N-acetyltransferase
VLIRPRTSGDFAQLRALAAHVHATDGYPVYVPGGDLLRFLTEPRSLAAWVAEEGGRLVGHVAVNSESNQFVMKAVREAGIEGDLAVVARLLVDPGARRQGIGMQLLAQARTHGELLGRTPVLDVVATSVPAVSLYREAGWKEIGEARIELPGQTISELVFVPSD